VAGARSLFAVAATVTGVTPAACNAVTLAVAATVVGTHLNAAVLTRVASLAVAHGVVAMAICQSEASRTRLVAFRLAVTAHGADALTRILLLEVEVLAVRAVLTLHLAVVDASGLAAAVGRLRGAQVNGPGSVILIALTITGDTFLLLHSALAVLHTGAVTRAGVAAAVLSRRNSQHQERSDQAKSVH